MQIYPTFTCPWCNADIADWWGPAYGWYECENCHQVFKLVERQEVV